MHAELTPVLADQLRAMFPPGRRVGEPACTVVEVRAGLDEVVLLVRWNRGPHLYGIPISLTDTSHEFYYTDYEVSSDDEWLDSVDVGLMVMMGTGHRATAKRSQVADYIELRSTDGWPVDERFCLQEGECECNLLAERLREAGLDPSLALERRAQKRLLVWLLTYENNATGGPWVGQSVVTRIGPTEAELEQVETAPGVPATVGLDLAYFASQFAAARGALTVTTSLSTRCSPLPVSGPWRLGGGRLTRASCKRTRIRLGRCSKLISPLAARGVVTAIWRVATCLPLGWDASCTDSGGASRAADRGCSQVSRSPRPDCCLGRGLPGALMAA